MECRHFGLLIQRYYDGELEPAERAKYENHRAECRACGKLDAQYAAVFEGLSRIPMAEPSAGFNNSVLARVNIARYRTSPVRRFFQSIRGGWIYLPARLRVTATIAAVFGLFVAVYTPVIGLFAAGARKAAAVIGSGLYIVRRLLEDPSRVSSYFKTSTNYKLAGKILMDTFERQISGIPVSHFMLITAVAVVALILVVRSTRAVWKKGETHVGIF
jgi:hypothetical protein